MIGTIGKEQNNFKIKNIVLKWTEYYLQSVSTFSRQLHADKLQTGALSTKLENMKFVLNDMDTEHVLVNLICLIVQNLNLVYIKKLKLYSSMVCF